LQLLERVFGEWVRELDFFKFRAIEHENMPLVVARSGWSPELGYEIYLQDSQYGDKLWDIIWEAGSDLGIKPGAPNHPRRVEAGMLSFGGDFDVSNSALDLGLPPQILGALKKDDVDFIGKEALLQQQNSTAGNASAVIAIKFDTDEHVPGLTSEPWKLYQFPETVDKATFVAQGGQDSDFKEYDSDHNGILDRGELETMASAKMQVASEHCKEVGFMTALAFSPRMKKTIAIATISNVKGSECGAQTSEIQDANIIFPPPQGTKLWTYIDEKGWLEVSVEAFPFEGTSSQLHKKKFGEHGPPTWDD